MTPDPKAASTTVPARHPLLLLVSVFGSFCAAPALGTFAAELSAPGSAVAQVVSPVAFLGIFAVGLLLWFGLGFVAMVGKWLFRVLRGDWKPQRPATDRELPLPPGHGAFVPLGLAFGALAGVVAGMVPEAPSFLRAGAVHVAAGGAYGLALRWLARLGYLPFAEPE